MSGLKKINSKNEYGSVTAMFVLLFIVLMAVLAIVVDGGRQLSSEIDATDLVNQASRMGAAQLKVEYLRRDQVAINSTKAIAAAEQFMYQHGHPGVAWVKGDVVYARVTYYIRTLLSSVVGINSLKISATGSALDVSGIGPPS